VQRIIQKDILDFNTEFGSKNIGILVMDPNNGEILAMASNKEYDLNNPRNLEGIYTPEEIAAMSDEQKTEALNTLWKNDTISYGYEPGSTFKPFTVSAGLEENIVSDGDTFYCDGGEDFGSIHIKCNKVTGHGTVTLGEALMKSCNDALMQIAAREGRNIFFDYQNSFGFGKKTGIDLPGEEAGLIIPQDGLNATELATSSFGQSITVTMVQMAAAFSSLVNGGNYYQPHVVKEIKNDNGTTIKNYDGLLVRQTVSEKTSDFIQKYMYQTVETGTAQGAQVEGYSIGGKTGTAQKQPREAKTYVVSFLGCAPAVNPEVVIYVVVDEPQNVERQADSSIATKFASRILNEILPVLGVYPDGEIDYLLPTPTPAVPGTADTGAADQAADTVTDTQNGDDTQQEDTQGQNSEPADNAGDTSDTEDTQEGEQPVNQENTGDTGENNTDPAAQDNNGEDTPVQEGQDITGNTAEDNAAQNGENPDASEEDEFNPDALE
jgi:stage V sporulation protein D (sporulation-specific penicillin-binding protein)